jgi:hypothetical protein
MGGSAEQRGKRQNCAEFASEAEGGPSNYFQFVPVPAECVEDSLSLQAC